MATQLWPSQKDGSDDKMQCTQAAHLVRFCQGVAQGESLLPAGSSTSPLVRQHQKEDPRTHLVLMSSLLLKWVLGDREVPTSSEGRTDCSMLSLCPLGEGGCP